MTTTTIRVSLRTRDLLQELAQTAGSSMQAVLEQYRGQQVLEATNAAYAALHAAPEAWANLEQERLAWEQTLADGLEET